MIHRIDRNGRELQTFDHGVAGRTAAKLDPVADDASKRMDIHNPAFNIEDPQTWGFTPPKRRVMAVGVESGRLFYSVAEGPAIWSLGLNEDGSFIDDARLEIDVTGTPNSNPVTGLAFDGAGVLFVTQRGEATGSYDYSTFARPQASIVSRYTFDDAAKRWSADRQDVAIGLEPVYRATNGGIALNYGYDQAGNIDYGQCRQTLWTTGEQLRAGQSDPSILNGLQGNDKSMLQKPGANASPAPAGGPTPNASADLTPPKAVWFTDKDGQFKDPGVHAHIGSIAIFNRCDGASALAPRPKAPLFTEVKPSTPGIYISKTCGPALFGLETQCDITITNVNFRPTAPIVFVDSGTVVSNSAIVTHLDVVSVTPDGPDFICSPTPSQSLTCLLPADALPPGKSRTVTTFVNTDPSFADDSDGFINCADLEAPYHGQSCFSNAEGKDRGLTITKSAPASCDPGGSCTFKLGIRNDSGLPFNGPLLISDEMLINGTAPSPASITSISPSPDCAGGNPGNLPMECKTQLTLAPGASKSFDVTITMPPGDFWAHNCFALTGPDDPPPGALSEVGTCAWVKVGNPPPLSNLEMTKTAGPCAKQGAGQVRCEFALTVTNTGPTPFSDVITFDEKTAPTGVIGSLDAAFSCAPPAGGTAACTTAAAIDLNPGQSRTFDIFVDTPVLDVDAAACFTPNTIKITSPVGGDKNFNGADDQDSALGDSALMEFFDPVTGLTTVICDPTNLRTAKTATGDCVKAGSGYECSYKITITNMGPDPYKGPLNLTDTATGATSVTASGTGFNCTNGASSAQCSTAPLTMAKGDKVELTVKTTVPDNGQCSAVNQATMSFPPSGTRFNGSAADDSDTASAAIPSDTCLKQPACASPADGEFASASGACVCKQGRTRDRASKCVADAAPQPASDKCPDGYPIPQNGQCPCASGQTWDKDKRVCTAACEPGLNEYRTSAGQCVCKSGYQPAADGAGCVEGKDDGASTPPPVRPPVTTNDDDRCDLGPNEYRTAKGRCVCKQGYVRRGGDCQAEQATPSCKPGPNEVRTSKGVCICKDGYERVDGRCVQEEWDCPASMVYSNRLRKCVNVDRPRPEPQPQRCPPDHVRSSNGNCVCRPGLLAVDGDCVPPRPNKPRECPNGYYGTPPNCKLVKPPVEDDWDCPSWQTFNKRLGKCVGSPPQTQQKECPNGYYGNYPNCKLLNVPKPQKPQVEDDWDCPSWQTFNKRLGKCVGSPPQTKPQGCGPGFYSDNGKCRRVEQQQPFNDVIKPSQKLLDLIKPNKFIKPKPQNNEITIPDYQKVKPQQQPLNDYNGGFKPKPLTAPTLQKAPNFKIQNFKLKPFGCPAGQSGTPPNCYTNVN